MDLKMKQDYNQEIELYAFDSMNNLSDENIAYIKKLLKKNNTYVKKDRCFLNAKKLALFSRGIISYAEGFIAINGNTIKHAWNIIEGKPFDISRDSTLTKKLPEKYEGVIIPYSLLKKHFQEHAYSGMVEELLESFIRWRKEVEEFERNRKRQDQ